MQNDSSPIKELNLDQFMIGRYQFISFIGKHNEKKVIKSLLKKTNELVTLKVQIQKNQPEKFLESGLVNEILILSKLKRLEGVPKLYHHGKWSKGHFLEMQLLQRDYGDSKEYSLNEMYDLTGNLLQIFRRVHNSNILIQDIRPYNIMRSQNNSVFISNFSCARTIPIRTKNNSTKSFIGSLRFASIRAHNMLQITKRDDLESLFYNIAMIYYGKLPWSKLNISPEHRMEKVKLLKVSHRQTLFAEMGNSFKRGFEYISNLQPEEEPNYVQLIGYFKRHKTLLINPKIMEHEKFNAKRISYNQFHYKQIDQKMAKRISHTTLNSIPQVVQKGNQDNLQALEQQFDECSSITSEQQIASLNNFKKGLVFKNPFAEIKLNRAD